MRLWTSQLAPEMWAKKIFPLILMIHRNWKELAFYMQGTASMSIWRHFNTCGVVQEKCPTVDIATDLCAATVPPKISIVPTIKNSIRWKWDSKCVLWKKKGRKLWLGFRNKYKEQIHPRQYSRNQLAYSNLTNHYECKYTIYQLFVLLYKTVF